MHKIYVFNHNEEPRTFIDDIPTEEPSFEAMTNYLKTFSKYIKEDENMSFKNKCLFGGWILMTSKLYRNENLSYRFEDWLFRLYKVKRQASYNYRNLFKLMSAAPKLINYKTNATYFVKNHEIVLNYLTSWKHRHLGYMRFLVCLKTVFHTLENQMRYKTLIKA